MEKKSSKPKTIQMRYPAPYSRSYTEPHIRRQVKVKKAVPSLESTNDKTKWLKPKPLTTGCDPYAPHLKYGLFRQKCFNKDGNLCKINLNKSASDHLGKEESRRTLKKEPANEPYFIIRPLNKNLTKQLSVSESMHVDIKPLHTSPLRVNAYRFNKHT